VRRVKLAAAVAAAALGLTGCGFHGLYTANLPGGANLGGHPFTVTIQFRNVLDLVPQSNVKVNDVAVGKVTKVELDQDPSLGPLKGWISRVTIKVNGNVDLFSNAYAAIKMTSLLGEKYVDLEQPPAGTGTGRLSNHAEIPLSRTDTAPEVEQVLAAIYLVFNNGGLAQIKTIATQLNAALGGHETAVRDLLVQLNKFVSGLDTQKNQITTAIEKINHLAVTLNQQQKAITNALDTFPQALEILKNDRSKLTQLLQSLANLGNTATGILTTVPTPGGANVQSLFVDSLKQLSPVLENLTATGSDFPKALQILLTFPFPLGKATDFLRTDYANLGLHLNMSLNDNLCGLNLPGLCDLIKALSPPPAKTAAAPKTASANTANAVPIQLPGVGG
jgi:phospholipid/cholesterol/gamma-HCH transport system substrate-binding protein